MGIVEAISSGFSQAVSLDVLPYLIVGSVFGLIVGVIPGLSGHFAMAMAVTFLYSMEPAAGIAFVLAAHATVAQGGGLTAILFSIPGTGQNAATLLDGPPMRDKGQVGTAVGAAMAACLLGATFGAVVLALLIPVLRSVVLLFGPPEILILAFLALTFVAVLGAQDMTRSLIAGFGGLLLAMIGTDNVTNTDRFTLGFDRLADGLPLVPVILGLFAVAEMIELWARGGSLAKHAPQALPFKQTQQQIFGGFCIALRKWWLVLRCSAIGTFIGLIPGLGSAPASFVAYAHAKQSSKDKESFGKGNVEGVIGAESANDAVEGGALASTIAFGIPGSSSMAILLSGLFILGLETGPVMLTQNVDIVFIMVFTIVLGNLIGTVVGLFLVNPLSRITSIRASIVVPVLTAVIVTGAFAAERSVLDIGIALVFGMFGYLMKALNYSRPALLIGFVLGFTIEKNLYLALAIDGPLFVLQPIPLALAIITLVFLLFNFANTFRRSNGNLIHSEENTPTPEPTHEHGAQYGKSTLTLEMVFLSIIGILVVTAFVEALSYELVSSRTPFVIIAPLLAIIMLQAGRLYRARRNPTYGPMTGATATTAEPFAKVASVFFWMVALFLVIGLLGHNVGLFLFILLLMHVLAREKLLLAVATAGVTTGLIAFAFENVFNIELYDGLLFRYFAGYRDF